MVASNTLELPYYKGIGRQRFWGPCASYWENRHSFLEKSIVPAAKRLGANLLEFEVPEVADVVSGKKDFKTAAKI